MDCEDYLSTSVIDSEEEKARKRLIQLCHEIADEYEVENKN